MMELAEHFEIQHGRQSSPPQKMGETYRGASVIRSSIGRRRSPYSDLRGDLDAQLHILHQKTSSPAVGA